MARLRCTRAEAGKYVPSSGYSAPIDCPPGTYQDEAGQAFCYACDRGRYSNDTGRVQRCDYAPAGKECPFENMTAPLFCKPGFYQDEEGMAFCHPCAKGQYSNETARTVQGCIDTPVGYEVHAT